MKGDGYRLCMFARPSLTSYPGGFIRRAMGLQSALVIPADLGPAQVKGSGNREPEYLGCSTRERMTPKSCLRLEPGLDLPRITAVLSLPPLELFLFRLFFPPLPRLPFLNRTLCLLLLCRE